MEDWDWELGIGIVQCADVTLKLEKSLLLLDSATRLQSTIHYCIQHTTYYTVHTYLTILIHTGIE